MTTLRMLLATAIAIAFAQVVTAQPDATAPRSPTTTTSRPATQASGPVDHNKLKEMLPEKLAGLTRKEATAERTGFGNVKVSTALATYRGDGNNRDTPEVSLQIFDYGPNSMLIQGMTAWTKTNVDRESDDGFSKSLKIQDQPAIQDYLNVAKAGQMQVLVGERFLVSISTANLSVEQFKKLGDELKLKELAALAK